MGLAQTDHPFREGEAAPLLRPQDLEDAQPGQLVGNLGMQRAAGCHLRRRQGMRPPGQGEHQPQDTGGQHQGQRREQGRQSQSHQQQRRHLHAAGENGQGQADGEAALVHFGGQGMRQVGAVPQGCGVPFHRHVRRHARKGIESVRERAGSECPPRPWGCG